jgi:hypothetical protein
MQVEQAHRPFAKLNVTKIESVNCGGSA